MLFLLSGVIQGSAIGPLMFLIFINELISLLENHGIKVKLFADDVKLYLRVVNDADIIKLQSALDTLSDWAVDYFSGEVLYFEYWFYYCCSVTEY